MCALSMRQLSCRGGGGEAELRPLQSCALLERATSLIFAGATLLLNTHASESEHSNFLPI